MSDTSSDMPANPPAGDDLAPPPAPVRFLAQFIRDLSFEVPGAPEIFSTLRDNTPEMTVTIDAAVKQIEGPTFDVTLSVSIEAKSGDKVAFILELAYGCIVELNPQMVPQEYAHSLLLIEVPRHMFPFVRLIVSNITGEGGFPPLNLQMVDFADIYRRKFAQPGEETAGAPAAADAPSVH
jgi:preprotein translocase subunit SecB